MSFTLTNNDGDEVRSVLACQECAYASTKNHFAEGPACPLCHSDDLEKVDTITV